MSPNLSASTDYCMSCSWIKTQFTCRTTSQGHLLQLDFLHDDDKFVTWVKGTCNVMRDHRDGIKRPATELV